MDNQKNKEQMDHDIKTSLIEGLCKNISFLVEWANKNEDTISREEDSQTENENENENGDNSIRRIINLTVEVMEFIDAEQASNLSADKLDEIVHGCLLDAYRMPSVANGFQIETVAFYDWWGRLIKGWIQCPNPPSHRRLGWRHLKVIIHETRDHLRPPPRTRAFRLKRRRNQRFRYYSAQRIAYEKITPVGRTLSAILCDLLNSPSPVTSYQGNALWFLRELDEEQPNNRDGGINYCCFMPRLGKRKLNQKIPKLKEPRVDQGVASTLKLLVDDYETKRVNLYLTSESVGEVVSLGCGDNYAPSAKRRKVSN